MARLTVAQMIRLAPETFMRNWLRAEGRKILKAHGRLPPIFTWLTVSCMVNAAPDLFTHAWQAPKSTAGTHDTSTENLSSF